VAMSRWSALAAGIGSRTVGALLDGRPVCLRHILGADGISAREAARLVGADRLVWLSLRHARSGGYTDCAICGQPLLLVG
jgi:hypothetical protein